MHGRLMCQWCFTFSWYVTSFACFCLCVGKRLALHCDLMTICTGILFCVGKWFSLHCNPVPLCHMIPHDTRMFFTRVGLEGVNYGAMGLHPKKLPKIITIAMWTIG